MTQWTDQQSWENEPVIVDEKWPRNSAAKNVGANSEKLFVDFRDSKRKSDGSVRNLYLNNKATAVKTVDFQSTTNANRKLCENCKTLEIPNEKKIIQESTRIFSVPDKSEVARINSTHVSIKTYEVSKRHGNDEWTEVRTKKRRFLLPKSLIIDSQAKNNHIGNHGISNDDFYKGIICRHCYLEALRIKNNKAEQKV